MKWQLASPSGYIGDLNAVSAISIGRTGCDDLTATDVTVDQPTTCGNSGLHYDSTANQFIYTWQTSKSMAGQCYAFTITLLNTATYQACFKFK